MLNYVLLLQQNIDYRKFYGSSDYYVFTFEIRCFIWRIFMMILEFVQLSDKRGTSLDKKLVFCWNGGSTVEFYGSRKSVTAESSRSVWRQRLLFGSGWRRLFFCGGTTDVCQCSEKALKMRFCWLVNFVVKASSFNFKLILTRDAVVV